MQSNFSDSAEAAIRRAEAAVEALSPSFQSWLSEEVEALVDACKAAMEERFSVEARQGIFLSAHTLKGQAAILGYPQIGNLARSLCRLLDYWSGDEAFKALTCEHIDAIDAVAQRSPEIARGPEVAGLVQTVTGKTVELLGDVANRD